MDGKHALKGELKDIYDRVMKTPISQSDNSDSEKTQKDQESSEKNANDHPTQKDPEQNAPPANPHNAPDTFVYSSKHPGKTKVVVKQDNRIKEETQKEDKQEKNTHVAAQSYLKAPYIAAGIGIFTIIYAVVWALFFGLV